MGRNQGRVSPELKWIEPRDDEASASCHPRCQDSHQEAPTRTHPPHQPPGPLVHRCEPGPCPEPCFDILEDSSFSFTG